VSECSQLALPVASLASRREVKNLRRNLSTSTILHCIKVILRIAVVVKYYCVLRYYTFAQECIKFGGAGLGSHAHL